MNARYLAFSLVAVALIGCNAGTTPSAVAVVTATPVPTPTRLPSSPTPVPTPSQERIRAVAAQAYNVAASRANSAWARLDSKYAGARTLRSWTSYWKVGVRIEQVFLLDVQAIVWPANLVKDGQKLIGLVKAELKADKRCAAATSWAGLESAGRKSHKAAEARGVYSEAVRRKLGLPPVPIA